TGSPSIHFSFAQGLLWLTSLPSIHFSFAQGLLWLTSLPSIHFSFAQGLLWLTSLPSIHFSFAQGLLWLTSLPSIHFLDIRRQGLGQRRGRSSFLWRTVAKEKQPVLRTFQVVPVSTTGTRNRDSTLCDPRSGDTFRPATVRRTEFQLSGAVVQSFVR
ncbi:hypothetical protein ACTVJH_15575, partial [Desulfoplanes sp. PS50]